jgi:hypothetical protein
VQDLLPPSLQLSKVEGRMARKKILKMSRSTTNRHLWTLLLSCGHQITLALNKRPSGKFQCPHCQRTA